MKNIITTLILAATVACGPTYTKETEVGFDEFKMKKYDDVKAKLGPACNSFVDFDNSVSATPPPSSPVSPPSRRRSSSATSPSSTTANSPQQDHSLNSRTSRLSLLSGVRAFLISPVAQFL